VLGTCAGAGQCFTANKFTLPHRHMLAFMVNS